MRVDKANFLKSKKIRSLLKEQLKIFQQYPDGAIIHRKMINGDPDFDFDSKDKVVSGENIDVNIRFLNNTFLEMFTAYRERLKLLRMNNKAANSRQVEYQPVANQDGDATNKEGNEEGTKQNGPNDNLEESDEDGSDYDYDNDNDEFGFLRNVYLQKSEYKINDEKYVEQIEEQEFRPMLFKEAIKVMQSGQVYSVLTKDEQGAFAVLSKKAEQTFAERVTNHLSGKRNFNNNVQDGYLIYVINQEVIFNEEISMITFFKDITFGVLYEQVKAQQQLQNAISSAIQSKMGKPLNNIVNHCKQLELSNQMKQFVDLHGPAFKSMVRDARLASKLLAIQFA
jgi:hypothetical protein